MALPPALRAALGLSEGAPASTRTDAAKRDPRGSASSREDGWSSILTGLGTTRDKRTSATFSADYVRDSEARDLWRSDDLAARAIEDYPAEMMRAGWDLSIQDDNADRAREISEAIGARAEDLGVDTALQTGLEWERAYGGAAIFPVGNDLAGDLSKPLNMARLGDVRDLPVFEPRELRAVKFYDDPLAPMFGRPMLYSLEPVMPRGGMSYKRRSTVIHESRLIIFPGIVVSRDTPTQWPGWGDNVLSRVAEVLRDFNMGFAAVSHILQDFAQAVVKIQGLADAVAADESKVIVGRMQVMDMSRSVARVIMLDAGGGDQSPEEFKRESTSVTGIPETLDRMIQRLAAALEEPVTMLMGVSPAGMNATGASDIDMWHKKVGRKQTKHLRPRHERLIKMLLSAKDGPTKGVEPERWCVTYRPLSQPTQAEIVATRKVQADTDAVYVGLGAPASSFFKSRFGGDEYSHDTKLDTSDLDLIAEAEQERAATPPSEAKPVGEYGAADDVTDDELEEALDGA